MEVLRLGETVNEVAVEASILLAFQALGYERQLEISKKRLWVVEMSYLDTPADSRCSSSGVLSSLLALWSFWIRNRITS